MSNTPTMEVTGLQGGHVRLRLREDVAAETVVTMSSGAAVEVCAALLEQALLAPAAAQGGLDGSVTVGQVSVADIGEHARIEVGQEHLVLSWSQVDMLAAQLLAGLGAHRRAQH